MTRWNLVRFGIPAIIVVAIAAAILWWLPIRDGAQWLLEWIDQTGPIRYVLLGALYAPFAMLMLPGSILTLAAGYFFGVYRGFAVASLGSTLGAACAFLVGRRLARDYVQRWVARSPRMQAIDQAARDDGFKIVTLLRLSPLFPFNVMNYALSVTHLRFRDYCLGSWLGMIPGTLLFVYIGSSLRSLGDLVSGDYEGGVTSKILLGVGLVATVTVTVFVTRLARRNLEARITPKSDEQETATTASA